MLEFLIRLRSVQDVQNFVALSTAQPFRVDVTDGDYTANGKSFMEMFCLCLANALTVSVDCDEISLSHYKDIIRRFVIS